MRGPKPGEEINGIIGQDGIWGTRDSPTVRGAMGFIPGPLDS